MGERCIDYVTDKNVDDGWERLVLTFQLPAEETISVFVGMTRARGTLLVSGVQLETGNVANELNLIHNPDLNGVRMKRRINGNSIRRHPGSKV